MFAHVVAQYLSHHQPPGCLSSRHELVLRKPLFRDKLEAVDENPRRVRFFSVATQLPCEWRLERFVGQLEVRC
jgi:hypothetical protein